MKKTPFLMAFVAIALSANVTSQELTGQESIADAEMHVPAQTIPSRTVTLQKNQYLDVEYPGIGWIYLGEIDATSLLKYSGRKMNEETTAFTLRGREEGSTILHFFKNDALTGEYIDDYLAVTIQGASRTSDHIKAPLYADIVPPRPSFTSSAILAKAADAMELHTESADDPIDTAFSAPAKQTAASATEPKTEQERHSTTVNATSGGATVIQNTTATEQTSNAVSSNKSTTATEKKGAESEQKASSASVNTDNLSSSEILSMAQKAFDAKEYEQCMAYLDSFFEKTDVNMDEGMYLQGRILESPSALRDIKKSLAIYKTIIRQYPESSVWEKANERITYIERFYFDIR